MIRLFESDLIVPKYCNKENGKEPFTLPELIELIPVLELEHDLKKISIIFFDGGLPIGKDG